MATITTRDTLNELVRRMKDTDQPRAHIRATEDLFSLTIDESSGLVSILYVPRRTTRDQKLRSVMLRLHSDGSVRLVQVVEMPLPESMVTDFCSRNGACHELDDVLRRFWAR